MALDLALCDKTCIGCIRSYKKKHSLQAGQKFRIKCSGIPDFEQLELFSAQNGNDTALGLLDPVKWAADTLDWHCLDPDGSIWKRKDPEEYNEWTKNNPTIDIKGKSRYHRPYQALLMQCSSRRKVFRMGRQCIVRDQYIYTPNGPIQVADLRESQEILGGISSFIDEHEDTIYLVKFANGSSLKVNGEHPFFTRSGWKNAINLSISDEVQFQSVDMFEINTSTIIDKDLAKLVGYLLSDGYFAPKQSVKFTNNNLSLIEDVEQLTAKFFPTLVPKRRIKSNGFDVCLTHQHGTHSHNPIDLYLKDLGVYDKITLGSILTTTDEAIKQFIAGYFNGDGYLWHYKRPTRNGYRAEIGFAIGLSQRKAYEFQYLLWRLGIHSVIKSEWMKKSTAPFYRVLVSRHSDQLKLLEFLDTVKYPEKFQEHKRILDIYKEKKYDTFSQIKSIKTIGTDKVWGWETTTSEIIGPLGMRTHNCGKTEALVIGILYNMFVKPGKGPDQGFEVIVVAPYQAQVDLLFRRLEQLINSSASTSNAIRRNVKAPVYTIELNNGSIIKGFTASTKSAGDAVSVRGQHADMLVFDEADFLASGDMDAALNIITNYPNASIWMSSTPSGKREKFFSTCFSQLWKEFYYPSSVNPMWNIEMDNLYMEQLTQLGYIHEILAEFGEQEQGVFQNAYIQNAKLPYKYGNIPRINSWKYTIGVDWNDTKIGTSIVVLGFDPTKNIFQVVDKKTVSKIGWTQTLSCQKIAELNRLWRPIAIYIDSGYGSSQWEILRKFGYDSTADPAKGPNHPDSKLREIVKKYEFGGTIEIRDLFTKMPIKKPAKAWLVESTVRRFESGDIKFSDQDEKLEKQLASYIIERKSVAGVPVYGTTDDNIGDHDLDALMLSVIAFVMEQTPFGKPKYTSDVAFSGQFGNKSQPLPGEGGLIITTNAPKKYNGKPDMERTVNLEQTSLLGINKEMPGAHLQRETNVGIWNWSGFFRDEPKPESRSLFRIGKEVQQHLGLRPRRGSKSTRKNI